MGTGLAGTTCVLPFLHRLIESFPRRPLPTPKLLRTRAGIWLQGMEDQSTPGSCEEPERVDVGMVAWPMARVEEYLGELLKLPVEDRAYAAKVLLDSLGDAPARAEGPRRGDVREGGSGPSESEEELEELEELAADPEGLRGAVRAAVEAELEPLRELTGLLRRLADGARTTAHVLQARNV